jgi:hypothetical protein
LAKSIGHQHVLEPEHLIEQRRELLAPAALEVEQIGLVHPGGHQVAMRPATRAFFNGRYGRGAIGFGLLPPVIQAFRGHAAFRRVPERWEF